MRWLAGRLDLRCAVSDDARALAHEALGGEYTLLFNGIEVERFAKAEPWPTTAPTIFFVGRHEPRKGLDVLLAALRCCPADVRLWVGGDGPETAALRRRHAGDPRVEWLGRISDEEKASRLRGRRRVLRARRCAASRSASCCSRRWPRRRRVVASDLRRLPQRGPGGRGRRCSSRPATRGRWPPRSHEVLDEPDCAEALVTSGQQRAEEFSMDNLAQRVRRAVRRL